MSSGTQLVVGPGKEATLVAAALAATGAPVTLVRTLPHLPSALSCTDGATWRHVGNSGDLGGKVYGPTVSATAPDTGLFISGMTHRLPLASSAMSQIVPAGHRRHAAKSFVRARARNALATIVGGGQEERTYQDWVVRRMGMPAFSFLYSDYAERRWGRPADRLSASLARMIHSPALASERVRPADSRDHGAERAAAFLGTLGVDVIESDVRRFHVDGKRVASVELADTMVDARNMTVWTTLSPARVAHCLGPECPPAARHLAESLKTISSGRVRLTGAKTSLPQELHILDAAPCWRFVRAPDNPDEWIVSFTGPATPAVVADVVQFAKDQGLCDEGCSVVAAGALPGGAPVWGPMAHARLRTVLEAWRPLGILATGSAGTLTPLDPTSLILHVQKVLEDGGAGLQEAWRTVAAPPTRVEDLDARFTHFFADS